MDDGHSRKRRVRERDGTLHVQVGSNVKIIVVDDEDDTDGDSPATERRSTEAMYNKTLN